MTVNSVVGVTTIPLYSLSTDEQRERKRERNVRQPQRVRRLWPRARLTLRTAAAAKDEGSKEERRLAKAFPQYPLKEYQPTRVRREYAQTRLCKVETTMMIFEKSVRQMSPHYTFTTYQTCILKRRKKNEKIYVQK